MIDLSWWLRHATLLWYVPIQLSPFRRGPPSKMENTLRENNLRGCHFSLSRSNRTTVHEETEGIVPGGGPSGCSSQPLRGIMILFHWRG